MTPERLAKVEELCDAARAQPSANRGAFLDRACRGDASLRKEIESLLVHAPANGPISETLTAGALLVEGAKLGHYRVEARLGAGGMGVVYRGVDTRLNRAVAIKVCAAQFTLRFRREAQVLSTLNHPHICTLFDVGADFLVMELIEGETMHARLRRGPLPPGDVGRLGAQIADALAVAHAKGVTHRDLKPGNIMLTRNGVKLLDFGLASAMGAEALTEAGAVMGTPAYMAPEQFQGEHAGPPTDIYALGLTLYEMAAGKRPVVKSGEPIAMESLPGTLGHIVERCLAEDPAARWQSAAEVRALLEWSGQASKARAAGRPGRSWLWPSAALALAAGLAVLGWTRIREAPAGSPAWEVAITPPPNTSFRVASNYDGGFALSPDGTMLAFAGRADGVPQLWVRSLNSRHPRLLPGTEGAYYPFWSPDSRSIAFFTATKPPSLKRIEVAGGPAVVLCGVLPNVPGGAWGAGGTIVLGQPAGGGLLRVSALGGEPTAFRPTLAGVHPHFLPGGRRFVCVRDLKLGNATAATASLYLASIDSSEMPRKIGKGGAWPQYSAGHLLFFSDNRLLAQPFDAVRAELSGETFPVADVPYRNFLGGALTTFSASPDGLLVFPPADFLNNKLVWRDRRGKQLAETAPAADYASTRIAPDGNRVAFGRRDGGNTDIWVEDLATKVLTRSTFDPGEEQHPVWSPDGSAMMYTSGAAGPLNLYRRSSGGNANPERVTTSPSQQQALDWSTDGRFLLFSEVRVGTALLVLNTAGGEPLSFLGQAKGAVGAQFNPGTPRWISYDFDDSGRREVYVQAFTPGQPASSVRWQISAEGGKSARWRGDGKELFYLGLDGKVMSVAVDGAGGTFRSSTPVLLFHTAPPQMRTPDFQYDVSRDGQRFLLVEPAEKPESLTLTLVTKWLAQRSR